MKQTIILLPAFLFSLLTYGQQNDKSPEINVVYGDKHIFTIETPEKWINDKESAQTIGLVNLFYAIEDSSINQKSYIYANAYDKVPAKEAFDEFIKNDLEVYQIKYPDLEFEIVEIEFSGGVRNGKLYSFSNLSDRYKEEVLYAETDSSIIVFSFSTLTADDYGRYQAVFDTFIKSFNYRGDNPQPFLDYMNQKAK